MTAVDRQNRLLVAEDWKRIYQSFKNADFQSYDFDNLRRTMINYLRENYPEDFNDYIESSEYLALIDLIAYLGQNLSFRIDLNARENFLELAERRESVLRLARLLSYNVKRNQAANGLLKFDSVSTTEDVIDSNNVNLSGQSIVWNDPSNNNWFEQFIKILNSALPVNGTYGRPDKKDTVAGVPTEKYRFNALNTDLPVYKFSKVIEGLQTPFEAISTDVDDGEILEEMPMRANSLAFLYRDDGRGAGSSNTGFFLHFRQGTLDNGTFSVNNPVPNQTIGVDARNINDTDVWLYEVDQTGAETDMWTKVDAVEGNNIIYNSINKNIRKIYSVLTRTEDRINLIFSDGVFGELPKGNFKVYYRTSANRRVVISPGDMQSISVRVPYLSRRGTSETLTITLSLKYVVDNGESTETNASIKANAPATYYTQNRMVTAEDYNVAPLAVSQDVVKVKTVNRSASGISRYFDLIDPSGKYSSVNLYGTDGVLYKQDLREKTSFTFTTQTDVEGVILNKIEPMIKNRKISNFYYSKFAPILTSDLSASWEQVTVDTNRSTGLLNDFDEQPYAVSTFATNSLKFIEAGTLCKFTAPDGYYFDQENKLKLGSGNVLGARNYLWTKVISVRGRGTKIENDLGPIVLNDIIPTGAKLIEVRPKLASSLTDAVRTQMIDQIFAYNTFGLRYDVATRQWRIITNTNLNTTSDFNTGKAGDVTNQNLDASWILLFRTDGEKYTVTSRGQRYVFESDQEIKFYYDSSDKIYDSRTGEIIKDKIQVMSINTQPDSTEPFTVDYNWQIVEEYRDADGYIDTKKIQVSFFDSDDDGIVDNPEMFDDIVDEENNTQEKYIFQKRFVTQDGVEDFEYVNAKDENIEVSTDESSIVVYNNYTDRTVFYFTALDAFKILDKSTNKLNLTADYRAFIGRDDLKFYYVHSADSNSRIDPAPSNIMDTYMLTRRYDTEYRQWLDGDRAEIPRPPSSDTLFRSYGDQLNDIKSISDEVIYHPVKYKALFGNKANPDLQATFKIVKNSEVVINDNDVKTQAIDAINQYFALENWNFGETFYFTELSAYIMNQLSPNIVSIVIVPVQENQTYGSLQEIKSESDEIFISGATVDDVEIIDALTATKLNASGRVITSSTTANTGIQSAPYTPNGSTTFRRSNL